MSDDRVIGEDEFEDDPEVMYCKLSEEDVAMRERIWLNNNKQYLRDKQEKDFRARMAPEGGKKQVKRRTRKPRMGEGQTSPASTAGEAAMQVMENRGFSKKLNYDAIRRMLDHPKTRGPGLHRQRVHQPPDQPRRQLPRPGRRRRERQQRGAP